MCKITLPTVRAFLLCYSLRCGCLTIFIWTWVRSLLCTLFWTAAIQEVFTKKTAPFGPLLVFVKQPITDYNFYYVFYSYIGLLIVSAVLFIFTIYLALGVYHDRSQPLVSYLTCRFVTWILEILFLVILSLKHKLFIAWYLGILFSVVSEFYAFVVVYGYYQNVLDYERRCKSAQRRDAQRESV